MSSVGIGSDYDGIESTPKGLEDVSKYPNLVSPSHVQIDRKEGKMLMTVCRTHNSRMGKARSSSPCRWEPTTSDEGNGRYK
jgi:hypothetical protein